MYKRYHKGITAFASMFGINLNTLTRRWSAIYEHRLVNRGKADAVKFMKELNTVAERYALHQQIEPIPWTKSDKDGFPTILGQSFRRNLRSKETSRVVMALSVMRTCELLRLPISQDISTVVNPCEVISGQVLKDIIDFIPGWVKRVTNSPITLPSLKYHISVRGGPNGLALKNSDSDISAVCNDTLLYEAIRIVEQKLNDDRPMIVEESDYSETSSIHSRLCQFPDKAGKTRTIGIVDYYSQRCLKPLHTSVMRILASLESDGTYSHQNVGKFAQQCTSEKKYIYCADLTAFTDRFPREIQRVLLRELIKDDELSEALWTLLAKRTFVTQWSGESVDYGCGQPMGAYSSWPLCSLAHHLLVEYCACKSGVRNVKSCYRLIGDDVIITNESLAQLYRKVISDLAITINTGKTVESTKASEKSGAEVAKQLYLNGTCLTPLTPGILRDLKKPHMFNTCVELLSNRYDFLKAVPIPEIISRFFHKKKEVKLLGLLCTNPINGVLKPGMPGYEEISPWITWPTLEALGVSLDDHVQIERFYKTVVTNNLLGVAIDSLSALSTISFNKGSPQETVTQPRCYDYVLADMIETFERIEEELTANCFQLLDLDAVLYEVSFVPDLSSPFMDRKELKQKRLSSTIWSLYNADPLGFMAM